MVLKYIVEIEHGEKGIGFEAREALKSSQRAGVPLVQQAKFVGQPTGSLTRIEVTVDEGYNAEQIRHLLENSGRLPRGCYEIKSVTFLSEEEGLKEKLRELEGQYRAAQSDAVALREENARLRAAIRPIASPLEGMLKYFDSLDLTPQTLLEDSADYTFARRVSAREITNTFPNYANHVLGRSFTGEQMEAILKFDSQIAHAELSGMEAAYRTALEELAYMQRLTEGSVDIPPTLRDDFIKVIEGKNHKVAIRSYEGKKQEFDETAELHQTLTRLRERYQRFAEHLEILEEAADEIPAVFNMTGSEVQIYLPFKTRVVRTAFIEDLVRELGSYFGRAQITTLPADYVAFEIQAPNARIAPILEDIPFTLKAAGFNRIKPYVFGRPIS